MNYNYNPQPQQYSMGYSGYKPAVPQYPQWIGQAIQPMAQQVRPVSSFDEVKACPIDFDGSVFYFADMANKRIYTKQINIDGTATINLYELKEIQQPMTTDQQIDISYVTKEEFENTIKSLKEMYEKALIHPEVKEIAQPVAAQPTTTFQF